MSYRDSSVEYRDGDNIVRDNGEFSRALNAFHDAMFNMGSDDVDVQANARLWVLKAHRANGGS